jgi:acyl-coenzyme A synthetase/AMP-(fatty) acid ligase
MPEYAAAEVFATCSAIDFAAAFCMVVAPAVLLGRDLVLFRPSRWQTALPELAGRPGVCLAPPALAVLGARTAAGRTGFFGTSFVPAGGGLTPQRAARISAGFPGCGFLTMLGSTETGLLTVGREVRDDGHVGAPLPGKPVWLEDIGPDGVGTLWTRGPDTRFAVTGGTLAIRPDGAVSTGDLAHRTDGGFVLDGRKDDLVKIDGVSVYPREVIAAVRALPGAVDASVSVDRSGAADRVTVVAVGDVTEEQVRDACRRLPTPVTPHRVVCRPADQAAYDARGKVLR